MGRPITPLEDLLELLARFDKIRPPQHPKNDLTLYRRNYDSLHKGQKEENGRKYDRNRDTPQRNIRSLIVSEQNDKTFEAIISEEIDKINPQNGNGSYL